MENTSADVCADSAYRSQEIEKDLKARGFRSRICRKDYRNNSLDDRQKAANKTRSSVRVLLSMCLETKKTQWAVRSFVLSGLTCKNEDWATKSRLQHEPLRLFEEKLYR